jgi:acetyl-CoA carboxylase carboxyl transferase subunit alpha
LAGERERRLREQLSRLRSLPLLHRIGVAAEERRLQGQLDSLSHPDASEDEIWGFVELARHVDRPYALDYIARIADDWVELHGDRGRTDDGAIVAGLGKLAERTVVIVGHQKGRDLKERLTRNYGMPHPEGYAKAVRAFDLADRFGFPVVSLIDTPGAYPGVIAEQHGQGGAIARAQARMMSLRVPSVACVIGEGGSGGAVALAVSDRVLMQENAIYSVITPEGCAQILWRDADEKRKAAAAFKPDAFHCLELGVIDGIVSEPAGGAQNDPDQAASLLKSALLAALDELVGPSPSELRSARRQKFRAMGVYA